MTASRLLSTGLRVLLGLALLLAARPALCADPTCPTRGKASEMIADCTAFQKHSKEPAKQGAATRQRSMAYAMLNDLPHALEDVHHALDLDAKDPFALTLLATYTAEQRKFDEADALFEQVAELSPKLVSMWFWRAAVEEGRSHYAKAIEYYTRALQLDPTQLYPLEWRAIDNSRLGRCSLAILDDNQLLKSKPDDEVAVLNRSYCETRQYNSAAAVEDASAVLKNVPDYAGAYVDRARAYIQQAKYDAALADYASLKQAHPKSPMGYLGPPWVHRLQGQDDLAATEYRAVLAMDFPRTDAPKDPYVSEANVMSMVRFVLTESKGQTQHATAHEGLAVLALKAGSLASARSEADQAVADAPDTSSAYRTRGEVEFAQQQWADAEKDFARAVANFPESPYATLWQYLAAEHGGKDGKPDLLAAMTAETSADWPTPVGLYYLGKASQAEVLASAASAAGASDIRKQQTLCEADFYLGEAALLRGDKAEAKRLFQATLATGVTSFTEYGAAKRELQSLP